jgi:hypothetical protein
MGNGTMINSIRIESCDRSYVIAIMSVGRLAMIRP